MPYTDDTDKGPAQRVRDLYDAHEPVFRPYWEAQEEELTFLSGDRYEPDQGSHNRDRRLCQIRGQETSDTIRHVVAKLTEKPRSIEARPVDEEDDADLAEVATSLIDRDLSDPYVGFNREFYQALTSSCEARIGFVWMDWCPPGEPGAGPYGSRYYSWEAPDSIMWDAAYHPHHPQCPWLLRKYRIDVRKARKLYKAPWLEADRSHYSDGGRNKSTRLGRIGQHLPSYSHCKDDNKVTLWQCWYKNDPSEKPVPKEADYQELPEAERYLLCESCGYRSEPEGALQGRGLIKGGLPDRLDPEGPDNIEGGCPECGGMLERVDAKATDHYERAYQRGRRLVIVAPFCQNPKDDAPLFDGEWPIPTARSFPLFIIERYVKPGAPMGPSDVTLMWDQQVASDQLATLAVQRVFEHRNYWILPRTGIVNYKGERFGFRDDDYNIMYRDGDVAEMYNTQVEHLPGTGLDPGFSAAYGVVQNALTRYRPQLDIGPAEDRSRDIPVGTIERQTAEAEVSTADFARRINQNLSMFYGVVWDYIRATLTYDEAARLRIEGIDLVLNLMGDSLPNYDFVVEESPDFTGLEEKKNAAFQGLVNILGQAAQLGIDPIELSAIYADINNLPKSVVRRFEKMLSEAQAKQEQMAAMGMVDPMADPAMQDPAMMEQSAEEQMIPGYAKGTPSQPGGMALVGEEGPELVNLARNTAVVPLRKLQEAADYLSTFGGLVPKIRMQDVGRAAMAMAPQAPEIYRGGRNPRAMLDWAMATPGVFPQGMTAYHGTPHKFPPTPKNPLGEFDLSKIGTGEGVQAYGHGVYVAESPTVARSYQGKVSAMHGSGKPTIQGRAIDWNNPQEAAAFELARHGGDREAAAAFYEKTFNKDSPVPALIRSGSALPKVDLPGRTYHLDLPDEHVANMLDWDAPLSKQPENVQAIVRQLGMRINDSTKGEEIYRRLAGKIQGELPGATKGHAPPPGFNAQAEASKLLNSLGIKGVRYLDQISRDQAKGTRNFVLFDPSITKITGVE